MSGEGAFKNHISYGFESSRSIEENSRAIHRCGFIMVDSYLAQRSSLGEATSRITRFKGADSSHGPSFATRLNETARNSRNEQILGSNPRNSLLVLGDGGDVLRIDCVRLRSTSLNRFGFLET